MKYIKKFKDIRLTDTPIVGGKNASLGQMVSHLGSQGIVVPDGFATTADAYWYYLEYNNLVQPIKELMEQLSDIQDLAMLKRVGASVRELLANGSMPDDLATEIQAAYRDLCAQYGQESCDVAVRSSATAEDLPNASFAGQQETYLNVRGTAELLQRCKQCIASLFTDRAIVYRVQQGFDHFKVALSVGVQKMIRSDLACAGVAFSLDTETGFKEVVMINGSWGLGEMIVKGSVIPDEFFVHKPTLEKGFAPIIKKRRGDKKVKMVYTDDSDNPTAIVAVDRPDQERFCLNDKELLELSRHVCTIERYYSELKGSWCPMDVEWAKDGLDGTLYIVQARPETVHASEKQTNEFIAFRLRADASKPTVLLTGQAIGQQMCTGNVRVIADVADIGQVQKGDVIVTTMTDPDWVPAMKRASGIITERGGRTCHAAIVSRELGIPALVGVQNALSTLKTGQQVTIDCSRGSTGYIYEGQVPFEKKKIEMAVIPTMPVDILVNIADPDGVFSWHRLPVDGVGLARLEFIISNQIQVHPMALVHPEQVTDKKVQSQINVLTTGYSDKKQFFIDTLAQGIGMIAATFYPRKIIVRLSDFKTNEYRNLIGGSFFEPEEENPMLGFRGASRYYHERYQEAFALECAALVKARTVMGFENIAVMVPFVRTVQEAARVIQVMEDYGLRRGERRLQLVMMVEIPSNVLLIEEFSEYFDGFSIGSNDLTQLTLGVDRDSKELATLFDERDAAVQKMMRMAVEGAQKQGRFIGICGQAPSDYPEIAQFLIDIGISSLSLNPDAVVPFLMNYKKRSC